MLVLDNPGTPEKRPLKWREREGVLVFIVVAQNLAKECLQLNSLKQTILRITSMPDNKILDISTLFQWSFMHKNTASITMYMKQLDRKSRGPILKSS